jgi:tRNA-2-methylthio-N6-dimethylallyladenosine synthase
MSTSIPKAYILTFGCQMNLNDSDRMMASLENDGFKIVDYVNDVDLVVINTCSVREKPEKKLKHTLDSIKPFKKKKPSMKIVVTGCTAKQLGEKIVKDNPIVDVVLGTDHVDDLINVYKNGLKEKIVKVDFKDFFSYDKTYTSSFSIKNSHAYVTVIKGCNNYCSYCIVPYLRGKEISRKSEDIINDVKHIVSKGIKSITLLGQNIARFGLDTGESFTELLYKVSEIKGIKRISFLTTHPRDFNEEIMLCFKNIKNLAPMLHLPCQHGSNKILKKMNRGYTREEYIEKIDKLKELGVYDNISLTTDVIIGFPGETERDFNELLSLLKYVKYDNSFSFIYSPRPGTKAYEKYGISVNPEDYKVYTKRLMKYQDIQKKIALEKNKVLEGKTLEVLVEGKSLKDKTKGTGRVSSGKVVNFSLNGKNIDKGTFIDVKIIKAAPTHLLGELV